MLKLRWNLTRTWSESIWEQQKFTNDDWKLLFSTEKAESVLKLIHKCDSALRYTHRGQSWSRRVMEQNGSLLLLFLSYLLCFWNAWGNAAPSVRNIGRIHWISMCNHKHLLHYTNLSNKTTSAFLYSSWRISQNPLKMFTLPRSQMVPPKTDDQVHSWPVSKHHNHSQAETFLFYCPTNEWTQIFICSPSTVLRGQQVVKTKAPIVIRRMKVFRTCGSTFCFLLS